MPLTAIDTRAVDLDAIRIASPCTARWDQMPGSDRVRFCGACRSKVYDLSYLSTDEARALVAEHAGGHLCLRLHRRADGTVITRDCPVGRSRRRSRWLAAAAALLGIGAAGVPGGAWVKRFLAGPPDVDYPPTPQRQMGTPAQVPAPAQPVNRQYEEMGGMACPDWENSPSQTPDVPPAQPRATPSK